MQNSSRLYFSTSGADFWEDGGRGDWGLHWGETNLNFPTYPGFHSCIARCQYIRVLQILIPFISGSVVSVGTISYVPWLGAHKLNLRAIGFPLFVPVLECSGEPRELQCFAVQSSSKQAMFISVCGDSYPAGLCYMNLYTAEHYQSIYLIATNMCWSS